MGDLTEFMPPVLVAKPKSMLISTRFTVVYTFLIANAILYMIRSGLNIVIIEMVNTENEKDSLSHCLTQSPFSPNLSEEIGNKPFDWKPTEVGQVLGAFYYGYSSTQILGGFLANKFGGKWIYGLGVLSSSICTLCLPLAAHINVYCFFVIQVFSGSFQGVTGPAMYSMFGRWSPMFERSTLATLSLTGDMIGLIISQSLAGYLCDFELFGGWPLPFYIFGTLGIFWFIIFCFTVYSYPEDHPRISKEELEFIKQTAPPSVSVSVSWGKIIRSAPFWGYLVGSMGSYFILNANMICIPQYLSKVQKVSITKNGLLVSVSYICCLVVMIVSSFITDQLREKGIVTTTRIRKLNQFLSTFFPALWILMIAYSGCNQTVAIIGLLLCNTFYAFSYSAVLVNAVDIAPAFAGLVFSVASTVSQFSGFIAPAIMMWTVEDDPYGFDSWKHLFFIFAGIYVPSGLVFIIFADGKTQDWETASVSKENKDCIFKLEEKRIEIVEKTEAQ